MTQKEQIEKLEKKITGIRDCSVKGHKWNISSINVFDSECTSIAFTCFICGAEKFTCWLHGRKHRKFVALLRDAFEGRPK